MFDSMCKAHFPEKTHLKYLTRLATPPNKREEFVPKKLSYEMRQEICINPIAFNNRIYDTQNSTAVHSHTFTCYANYRPYCRLCMARGFVGETSVVQLKQVNEKNNSIGRFRYRSKGL